MVAKAKKQSVEVSKTGAENIRVVILSPIFLLRPVVRYLRAPELARRRTHERGFDPGGCAPGVRVLPYLDDFLAVCRSRAGAEAAQRFVSETLARLGIWKHPSKGVTEPNQVVDHLGLTVDLRRGEFKVTAKRVAKLKSQAENLLCRAAEKCRWVGARELSSFIGLAAR